MPVLYIFEANQTVPKNPKINKSIEQTSCHAGTPKGIRTIITTGEVSGIIDSQKAIGPSGLFTTAELANTNEKISGMVTGNINCCVSDSLSTAEPMAANKALYNKYPPKK